MQRSHSDTCQKVPVGSLDPGVDVAASKTTLVERKRSETLTLDAQTCCGRFGDLKSNAKQLVILPFGLGCWGSIGAMKETTDEALRMLQSQVTTYMAPLMSPVSNRTVPLSPH